jgi:hypothetical protein
MNSKINITRNVPTNEVIVRVVSEDRTQVRTLTFDEQRKLAAAVGNLPDMVDQTQKFPPLDAKQA